jgi:hypothetical protein
MSVELNHTIVPSRDQRAASKDLAGLLGLQATSAGHFDVVQLENGVSLDFMDVDEVPRPMHLAFLVSEETFDEVFGRIRDRDLPYYGTTFDDGPDRARSALLLRRSVTVARSSRGACSRPAAEVHRPDRVTVTRLRRRGSDSGLRPPVAISYGRRRGLEEPREAGRQAEGAGPSTSAWRRHDNGRRRRP